MVPKVILALLERGGRSVVACVAHMVFVSDSILNPVLVVHLISLVRLLPVVHVINLAAATVDDNIVLVIIRFG